MCLHANAFSAPGTIGNVRGKLAKSLQKSEISNQKTRPQNLEFCKTLLTCLVKTVLKSTSPRDMYLQDFGDASVGDAQLARDDAGADALRRQLDDLEADVVGKRAAIDEDSAQLVHPTLPCKTHKNIFRNSSGSFRLQDSSLCSLGRTQHKQRNFKSF